jgi:hypothetical protein
MRTSVALLLIGLPLHVLAAQVAAPVAPCCAITAINPTTGLVTARETVTGRTFSFTATPGASRLLRVGQPIYSSNVPSVGSATFRKQGTSSTGPGSAACGQCQIDCVRQAESIYGVDVLPDGSRQIRGNGGIYLDQCFKDHCEKACAKPKH